ncbi:unnamed protein product [Nippostrongylus brasiliensis]|uniref:UBIQUITIN_CONJUGAT_2 domain-containing protein n=1 Tax=Nippostrongylus brasiliensis TaxID=27835 RepID=A0A0N4YWA3_NIPBR|nr:unnamed protein product [Nippostrongylus brasiliensis]
MWTGSPCFPKPPTNPHPTAVRRLQRDYERIMREPIDGIVTVPDEGNILQWHYVLRGSPDTPYEGIFFHICCQMPCSVVVYVSERGYYYGKIVFQPDFPWKPPAICMITPNGRFETDTRLCLSISDYHPETWNPGWTVASILIGLHSFMNEDSFAAGVKNSPDSVRRQLAANSRAWNLTCSEFMRVFPNLMDECDFKSSSTCSSQSKSGDCSSKKAENSADNDEESSSESKAKGRSPKLRTAPCASSDTNKKRAQKRPAAWSPEGNTNTV